MNINPVDGQISPYLASLFKNDHKEAVYIADINYAQDLINKLASQYNGTPDLLSVPSGTFKDAKPSNAFVQAADNLFLKADSTNWQLVMQELGRLPISYL